VKLSPTDRSRLSWQPGDVKFSEDSASGAEVEKSMLDSHGLFSDIATEKARVDAAHGWHQAAEVNGEVEKVGPEGYVHGWIHEGIPAADVAAVHAHQAEAKDVAEHTKAAAPGSHGHAEELRQLGNETELNNARNIASLQTSKPGPASLTQTRIGAGTFRGGTIDSEGARALHRAAKMIDNGQPSLARAHSNTIREVAQQLRRGNPKLADRLSAAADKLDQLPASHGLTALPEHETAEETARTAAARAYAKKVAKLEKQLQRVAGTTSPEWYNRTMNEEAGTPEVVKVGPHGYIHGWIKVGPNGEHAVQPGDEVLRTDIHGTPRSEERTYRMTDKPGRLSGTHTLSFTPANTLGQSELNDVPARQIVPASAVKTPGKTMTAASDLRAGDTFEHTGVGGQWTLTDDPKPSPDPYKVNPGMVSYHARQVGDTSGNGPTAFTSHAGFKFPKIARAHEAYLASTDDDTKKNEFISELSKNGAIVSDAADATGVTEADHDRWMKDSAYAAQFNSLVRD
jgi:hypothetical protein